MDGWMAYCLPLKKREIGSVERERGRAGESDFCLA